MDFSISQRQTSQNCQQTGCRPFWRERTSQRDGRSFSVDAAASKLPSPASNTARSLHLPQNNAGQKIPPPVSASKKTDEPYADVPEGEDKSEDGGLISVDRNSKATLPLTIPRPLQVVYEGSGAGKRRLGFDAGNAAELLSTSPAGRTRLGTGNTSAPLSLRLLRLPAARVSLLLAWILT